MISYYIFKPLDITNLWYYTGMLVFWKIARFSYFAGCYADIVTGNVFPVMFRIKSVTILPIKKSILI